ncbi:MAG: OB-fold protein [Crocinitomicaceae bacterium]
MKTKQFITRYLLSSLLLSAFFLMAVASGQEETEKTVEEKSKTEKPVIVSSVQLYEDYEANQVAADEKYKDKVVQVSGTIIDISKNPIDEDEIIVKLNGLIDNEYEIMGVSFYFDKSHASEVASLSKGADLTIKGLCKGSVIGVSVEGCSLVK